jgi:septal ring factor EnvC (AmiA/AmiB activator)
VQRALEASEDACSTLAARVAELEQQLCQVAAQLPELQDKLSSDRQLQAQLQQELITSQSKLCSAKLQVIKLKDSVEALTAQVGHQCSEQLRTETGQGCSVRGSMFSGQSSNHALPSALHAPYALS